VGRKVRIHHEGIEFAGEQERDEVSGAGELKKLGRLQAIQDCYRGIGKRGWRWKLHDLGTKGKRGVAGLGSA